VGVVSLHPTPKVEGHPLSAVRNLRTRHAVVTADHLTWLTQRHTDMCADVTRREIYRQLRSNLGDCSVMTSVPVSHSTSVYVTDVSLGRLVVACLSLDPRFAGSNLAKGDGFLKTIKIRSMTFFGGSKWIRRKILRYESMKEILRRQNSAVISSPTSLPDVPAGYCQRALLGESGSQMGKHKRSVMVAVCGMPYAIPPRDQ
jgi:hypothetical protein